VERRHVQTGDLGAIAEIRHRSHAGPAAHHQAAYPNARPAEAARGSPGCPITNTAPAGGFLSPPAAGWGWILEHRQADSGLPRRDIAQGEGNADHALVLAGPVAKHPE